LEQVMTPTNPTDAQMKLAREALAQAATELAPPSSSMRMNDFTDKAAQISARAIVLAIQATEARAQGLVDALNGYKAAVAFVAADAWDGCSDCIDVLKAARCADTVESLTPDEIAANLKRIRLHFQPPAKHSQHGGERER
jgi:hypothetical protein